MGVVHGQPFIKRYASEKAADEDGGWRHERITLYPDSDQPHFQPIVLTANFQEDGLHVVAEFLMTLSTAESLSTDAAGRRRD